MDGKIAKGYDAPIFMRRREITVLITMSAIEKLDYEYKNIRIGRILLGMTIAFVEIMGYQKVSKLSHMNVLESGISEINLETFIDAYIPLIPEFVWAYYLFPVGLIVPALLNIPYRLFLHYALAFTLCFSSAFVVFYFVPVLMDYQPITCAGISCDALRLLRTTDIGNNLIPSLHAGLSLVAFLAIYFSRVKVKSTPLWVLVAPLYFSVIVSTVLIKQHYFIDVPAGLAWAVISWYVAFLFIKRMTFTSN